MLNYIKAELYRSFNRLYFWLFTGIMSGLALLFNILTTTNHSPHMGLTTLMDLSIYMLTVPVFLVIMFIDMIAAEENKNLTIRNVVSYGLPRTKIVLSKIAAMIVLSFISALIILFVFYGSGTALFGLGSDFPGGIGSDLMRMLAAVPLWIGAIAMGTFLAILINNTTLFVFVYVGVALVLGNVMKILSILVSKEFIHIYNILIVTQLGKLSGRVVTNHDLFFAAMIGVIYAIVFTVLSVIYFNKKEVK